jgi:GH24 family phage-related lysozyme (muramidase)
MAATSEDLARLLVSIEFTQKQSMKQLAAIAKAGGDTAQGIETRFQKANDNVGKSFEATGKKVVVSVGQQRAAVQNLSFQLNDIATSLSGGASPFQVMMQQGSQVAQALGSTGGGLGGVVRTLGGAFSTMANPISIASFALIGLTGYAIQYFSSWLNDGKRTSEEIEKQAGLVQKVAESYGAIVPALREYADELKRASDSADRLGALKATRSNVTEGFAQEFNKTTESILGIVSAVPDANREFGVLASKIASNSQTAEDFQRVIDALNVAFEQTGSKSVSAAVLGLQSLQKASERTSEALASVDGSMKAIDLSMEQLKDISLGLTSQLIGLGSSGSGAIKQIADAVGSYLGPALGKASGVLDTMGKTLDTVGKSQGASSGLIKGFEGFRPDAYWDVNAYRTGFGSDTTTRSDGTIEKVTKETMVTLEDAERDLSRRIVEFQSGVQRSIGIDTWRSLSEAQQAALTSIAYNYGSLPDAIVTAIKSGGGPEKVAQAIAALSSNPGRRKQEAETYLSGTGVSMSDAGLGSNKKSPAELFNGDVAQVQKRIDLMNAEYEAQAKLNPLVSDYGYEVEKAKIQQQLLSEAQKAGLEITPEIAESIGTLAENYARASVAGEQLKVSQDRIKQSSDEWKSTAKDVTSGFINDLRNGVSAADALSNALDKVVDKLLDVALNSVFGGGGGGIGGAIGSLFGFASGGVAAHGRPQPMKTFARGGVSNSAAIFGEAGPEAAVPLPDGRHIPVKIKEPSVMRRSSAGNSTFAPVYNIDARGADQAAVARLERGLQQRDSTESKRVSGRLHQQDTRKVRP